MLFEPTKSSEAAWALVARTLERARERARTARTREDFAGVADACAEVLFLLVYAIHVGDPKQPAPKVTLEASTIDLLDRCIAQHPGAPFKDFALAGLRVVSSHHGAGVVQADTAAQCLKATETVFDYLSNAAGLRSSQDTVKDVCERFIAKHSDDLGKSQFVSLGKLARSPIGQRIASELTEEDLFDHARRRRANGISGATISQDITYLRGALIAARKEGNLAISIEVVDRAKAALRKAGHVGHSEPRDRRPTREELQRLVEYFETPAGRGKKRVIPMRDVMEFSLWSARRIGEICDLRWRDLDAKKENCKARVSDARGPVREISFPLLGKARDIIMRQPQKPGEPRIFPYNSQSVSAAYTLAKKVVGIKDLRMDDLRREAAIRLYESGHGVEQIAKVTGRTDLNTLLRDVRVNASPSTSGEVEPDNALAAKGTAES